MRIVNAGPASRKMKPVPTLPPRPHSAFRDSALRVVALVPKGKLVSYGQVAAMAGRPRAARQVGWILHGLPDDAKIPWQRVVNAKGYIPSRGRVNEALEQMLLLRDEGIEVNDDGTMDLERYRWDGNTD
jgi:methylated-DNA-protein-cysteine methyltransferase-like protein